MLFGCTSDTSMASLHMKNTWYPSITFAERASCRGPCVPVSVPLDVCVAASMAPIFTRCCLRCCSSPNDSGSYDEYGFPTLQDLLDASDDELMAETLALHLQSTFFRPALLDGLVEAFHGRESRRTGEAIDMGRTFAGASGAAAAEGASLMIEKEPEVRSFDSLSDLGYGIDRCELNYPA